jgi:uncharacterized membrane protein (UPF0182 family)
MNWRQKLISADNSEVDIKAVISALALFIAVVIYTAYAIKGLIVKWDMPSSIRDITAALIIGGVLGAGSTLFNQKLGVRPTILCKQEENVTPPVEGPVG